MSDEANLDAYLRRINYAGSIAPTLETLQEVHRLHVTTIPFENLDPLMELPVRLQLSDIEQKLLLERRGGYCLEHNLLLRAVLESMDYAVTPVGAGVLWGHEPDYQPQQYSHIALIVDVGGATWLADVGFGGPGCRDQSACAPTTSRRRRMAAIVCRAAIPSGGWNRRFQANGDRSTSSRRHG